MIKGWFFSFGFMFLLALGVISCGDGTNGDSAANDTIPDALKQLNKQISNNPKDPALLLMRADWYRVNGKLDLALTDARVAIQLDTLRPLSWVALGKVDEDMNKFPEAVKANERAFTLAPTDNDVMLSLARINIIFKKSETAFHLIQKAIENKRINPQAYYLAGVGYLDMGDTLSAINSFQTATQQDMNHFDAWLYLGMIYKGKNDVLADGYFKNAIRINPESKVAWYLLGMHYQNMSKIKESESAYDSALRIDPRFKDALYAKGYLLLVETDKYEEAIKLFSDALTIDPKFTDALYNRGYAYELNGQKELAKKDYEDVLKLQANYSKAVQGLNRL